MSRENLKKRLLECVKELCNKELKYISSEMFITEYLQSTDIESRELGEDSLRRYMNLLDLKNFLETEKFNPFTKCYANYRPGAVPAYPEGKTFYMIDDTDIEIIEEDLNIFINDILTFLEENRLNSIYESLQPEVISNHYISIIQRCIFENYKEN